LCPWENGVYAAEVFGVVGLQVFQIPVVADIASARLASAAVGFGGFEIVALDVFQYVGVLIGREGVELLAFPADALPAVLVGAEHEAAVEAVRLLEAQTSPLDASLLPHLVDDVGELPQSLVGVALHTHEAVLDPRIVSVVRHLHPLRVGVLLRRIAVEGGYVVEVGHDIHIDADDAFEMRCHEVEEGDAVLAGKRVHQDDAVGLLGDVGHYLFGAFQHKALLFLAVEFEV